MIYNTMHRIRTILTFKQSKTSQFKIVKQMYDEEIHFGKLLLKQSDTVLAHLNPVTLTFDPMRIICYPGWMFGT